MTFTLAAEVQPMLRPGVLQLTGAVVVERDRRLDAPLARAEAAVRVSPPDARAAVRRMYARMGIDPTRRRPSSEALLRRVCKGGSLPRINTLVDVCNWCSLEAQLPFGLYDASHIVGDVVLRLGMDGESYPGIRKDDVHVAGRIAVADDLGAFGNPTSDSARTMVTTTTTNALVVVFAPREVAAQDLCSVIDLTARRMKAFTGATRVD